MEVNKARQRRSSTRRTGYKRCLPRSRVLSLETSSWDYRPEVVYLHESRQRIRRQSNPVADGMAGIAQDQSGVSAAQSTGASKPKVPQAFRAASPTVYRITPRTHRPRAGHQFAGQEAEIPQPLQQGRQGDNERQRAKLIGHHGRSWNQTRVLAPANAKITAKRGIALISSVSEKLAQNQLRQLREGMGQNLCR